MKYIPLSALLKGGDFYRERHQVCFDAAMALFQRGQAVDQVTLAGELARTEKLDLVGGMAYLSHLVSITPTSVHAEYYAQSVSRTSGMRRLIDAGNRIVELGYADTDDVEATMRRDDNPVRPGHGGTGGTTDFRPVAPGKGAGGADGRNLSGPADHGAPACRCNHR